jgi:hypothetical protein
MALLLNTVSPLLNEIIIITHLQLPKQRFDAAIAFDQVVSIFRCFCIALRAPTLLLLVDVINLLLSTYDEFGQLCPYSSTYGTTLTTHSDIFADLGSRRNF